jgi:hypothetical protein
MTSTATRAEATTTASRNPLLAAIGVVTSLIATAIGTFWDISGNDTADHTFTEYLWTVGTTAVCAAIVFGLVVRTAAQGNASRRAAILGVFAVLSIAVFWAGFPLVLAAGALACALADRDRVGSFGVGSKVGLALGALAAAVAAVLAVIG